MTAPCGSHIIKVFFFRKVNILILVPWCSQGSAVGLAGGADYLVIKSLVIATSVYTCKKVLINSQNNNVKGKVITRNLHVVQLSHR